MGMDIEKKKQNQLNEIAKSSISKAKPRNIQNEKKNDRNNTIALIKGKEWYLKLLKLHYFNNLCLVFQISDKINHFFSIIFHLETYILDTDNQQNQQKYLPRVLKIQK